MGADFQSDHGIVEYANRVCSCCRQVVWEGVAVSPMFKGYAFFCLSCCDDITEAAKEAAEESTP